MRNTPAPRGALAIAATIAAALAFAGYASEATSAPAAQVPAITWGPAPAVLPAGAQMAVMQGDPSKAAPFTIRLRFPNGYKIQAHTHPTDEFITVISGSFKVGMGSKFDAAALQTLPTGGFVTAPALMAHYAEAKGKTIVQITSIGPFALNYVNPADAPKAGR